MRSKHAFVCLFGLALLAHFTTFVWADDAEDDDAEENAAPAHYDAPRAEGDVLFLENFEGEWPGRWKVMKTDPFTGAWERGSGSLGGKGLAGDQGAIMGSKGQRHAMAVQFDKNINNDGKTLVVQYELRAENKFGCDGGYIKLLSNVDGFSANKFKDDSPYTIMFGPDKCGATDKVHFILRHKSPKTGEFEEKHLKNAPHVPNDKKTHVYTLVIREDNSFDVLIDGETKSTGSLLDSFDPPVNPPKQIDDPTDKKPSDWIDEEMMDDPEATKPDDWDEDAPKFIPDEDAVKPAEWHDDEPEMVSDPDAVTPDDWDEEEDGEWEAPLVPNPKCKAAGCGEWKRPTKANPDFKGKWVPPKIKNPKYIGVWAPKQIDNPNYFVDEHPHNVFPIAGLGIELLTNSGDMVFDNILLTHDEEVAQKYRAATWGERSAKEAVNIQDSAPSSGGPLGFMEWAGKMFQDHPVPIIIGLLSVFVMIVLILWRLCFYEDDVPAPRRPRAPRKKDDEPTPDDPAPQVEEVAASAGEDEAPAEEEEEQDEVEVKEETPKKRTSRRRKD